MKLDDYKTKFDFNPPEGYFDTLADRVMERISAQEQAETVRRAKRGRILKISAWIASAAAVLIAGMFALTHQNTTTETRGEKSLYEDYATYSLIESTSTYSLCDYFYQNTPSQEVTYSAGEFADYGYHLSADMIIDVY
ncbi:MAG: hypothetical protein J5882_01875 [Bacteroidales bacterium]|nr:hypothetical protein [Bacteroidales bacterium]